MNLIWNTAAAVIASLGGGGAIVWFLVKWYSNIVAEKYTHKLLKEIEQYKIEMDKKLYIRQKHFDLELSIYKDFMSALVDMTDSAYCLFPRMDELPADETEQNHIFQLRGNTAAEKFNIASSILFKNAPFVDGAIYEKAKKLRFMCLEQIQCFKSFKLDYDAPQNCAALPKEHFECFKRSSGIMDERDCLIEEIRKYLLESENICNRKTLKN